MTKTYSAKEVEKIVRKCKRKCSKAKKGDLEKITRTFSYKKLSFANYESFYACKMLIVEFFDKKVMTDYLEFIKDIALEYIEPQDLEDLIKFIENYIIHYNLLWRVLKNVRVD